MSIPDMSDDQFEDMLRRCGFRREGLEGFYTVVWARDGTPHMGVSVKSCGPSRASQFSHLVKARNRYLVGDAIVLGQEESTYQPVVSKIRVPRANRSQVRRGSAGGFNWLRRFGMVLALVLATFGVFVLGAVAGASGGIEMAEE